MGPRRMRRGIAAAAALSSSLAAAAASAQVDAERLKPAVTADGWVTAEGAGVRPRADPLELGLVAGYALNPLVVVGAGGELEQRLVGGRVGIDALGSVTIARPLAVGLDLPLFVGQRGDGEPTPAGIGDLRLVPKLRLLDDRRALGLALAAEVRLPTHAGDFAGGASTPVFAPRAILDHRFRGGLRVGVNLGAVLRERVDFYNVSAGSELAYAAAVGYRFGRGRGPLELGGELTGGVGLTAADAEELPLEGLLFLRAWLGHEWELVGGPGFGLVPGYGVPTFRAFLGVRYRLTRHDRDYDGASDREDGCPDEPEDVDRYQDLDGCPEVGPDADHDGVPDYDDRCPDEKESINGVEDDDGCPDSGDPRVIYEEGEFRLLDDVRFEHGSAVLTADSRATLDQVALILKAHEEFTKIRIEGHTDDTGPDAVNQRLSQQRAEAVRAYLVARGVESNRLVAQGFGDSRPKVKGTTEEDRAVNRRVDFILVESSE